MVQEQKETKRKKLSEVTRKSCSETHKSHFHFHFHFNKTRNETLSWRTDFIGLTSFNYCVKWNGGVF